MARVSGNVSATGEKISNTGNNSDFSVALGQTPGSYRITFGTPFSELPSVLVNIINWDAETSANTINIGVVPHENYVDIELWRNNNYASHSFSFAAFGEQ